MSYYSVIIVAAFTSIVTVLILLFFLYKLQRKQQELMLNAQLLCHDLEELCKECLNISDKVVRDIDKKVGEGKKIFNKLESINNKAQFKQKENDKQIFLSGKNKDIIQSYQEGYGFKEISQKYGIGQDQVAMIVQLHKDL